MLKQDKPPTAERETQMYKNIWTPEEFPFNEARYQEVLKEEEEKAEIYKKKQVRIQSPISSIIGREKESRARKSTKGRR